MTTAEKIARKAIQLSSKARELRVEACKIEYSQLSCSESRELARGDAANLLAKIDKLSEEIKELIEG